MKKHTRLSRRLLTEAWKRWSQRRRRPGEAATARGLWRPEPLEARQMLAADLWGASDSLVGPLAAQSDPATDNAPITSGLVAEGEHTAAARDLVAFAQALAASGTTFFGAAWCPHCTDQKRLFEDGGEFLPFVEVTNPDRSRNSVGEQENITSYPTWEFPDGSRLTGVQTLETLSQRSGVPIPTSTQPFLAPLSNVTLLNGSPLHISLDGYDPNGGPLTYTVTSSNPSLIATSIPQNNPSVRITVDNYGDMVFELFEDRVPRVTDHFTELVSSGFYNKTTSQSITFHRVIDNFMIQAGDPTGTGGGGSSLGDFDDQFHVDLQHNRSGVLSYAKAGDDTNDSQFFVTEAPARHLDFNHSIFGQLIEGDKVREAISEVPVDANDKPNQFNVTINKMELFQDQENAVLMLKALAGSGEGDITVTVSDSDGHQFSRTFHVTVQPDTVNSDPFLGEIAAVHTTMNTPVTVQLTAVDVENDPVIFEASQDSRVQINTQTGLVTVTPATGFVGQFNFTVGVRGVNVSNVNDPFDRQQVTVTVAPNAPTGLDLLPESDTGISNTDNLTNAASLKFRIDGVQNGALVRLQNGSTVIDQVTATGTSVVLTTSNLASLGEGTFNLTATQLVNGAVSAATPALTVTRDVSPPAAMTSTPPSSVALGSVFSYDAQNAEEGTTGFRYTLGDAPQGATIDVSTGVVSWQPAGVHQGANQFDVVATDAAGNSRVQELNVNVTGDVLMEVRLQATDLAGNPINSIGLNQQFILQALVEDLRSSPTGVFAAYMDVTFNNDLLQVDGQITYNDPFQLVRSGTITGNTMDEIGAAATSLTPTGSGELLLFSVPLRAQEVGNAIFSLDPPDDSPAHDLLLYDRSNRVPAEQVRFQGTSINVGLNFLAVDDTFNFDEDSSNNVLNVLANDTFQTGSSGTLTIVSVGQTSLGGTVQISQDNKTLRYTPPTNFAGEDIFTYRVTDGQGTGQATVRVEVHPINDNPQAVNDTFNITRGSSNNLLDVLANDLIAPDTGETLRVTALGTTNQGGQITIGPNGTHVLYTPASTFSGTETFTYTISDGNGGTAQATATITVGAAPTPGNDSFTVQEDSVATTLNVLTNDAPANQGEALTITAVGARSNGGTVTITENGTRLAYTPAPNFAGTETFTYTVKSGQSGSAQGTVTVTVTNVNDPPTATNDNPLVVKDTANQELDVLANDSFAPDTGETLTIQSVTQGSAGGTVSISSDNRKVRYTPPTGFEGNDTFSYTISDGNGGTATANVTVRVVDFIPSSLSGMVYLDVNNDGIVDVFEQRVGGVLVTLTGTDDFGNTVHRTQRTDARGNYSFTELAPGNYTVAQTQPLFLADGRVVPGSQGGNALANALSVQLPENTQGTNNNFAERGRTAASITLRDFLTSRPHGILGVAGSASGSGWYAADVAQDQTWSTIDSAEVLKPDSAHFEFVVASNGSTKSTRLAMNDPRLDVLAHNGDDNLVVFEGLAAHYAPNGGQSTAEGEFVGQTEPLRATIFTPAGDVDQLMAQQAEGESWSAPEWDLSTDDSDEQHASAVDALLADQWWAE